MVHYQLRHNHQPIKKNHQEQKLDGFLVAYEFELSKRVVRLEPLLVSYFKKCNFYDFKGMLPFFNKILKNCDLPKFTVFDNFRQKKAEKKSK